MREDNQEVADKSLMMEGDDLEGNAALCVAESVKMHSYVSVAKGM